MNLDHRTWGILRQMHACLLAITVGSVFAIQASAQTANNKSGQALIFPTNRPVKGRVIDSQGFPIVGAVVSHFADSAERYNDHSSAPFKFANSASTDLLGRFELKEVNARRGRACIFHKDFQFRWLSPISLYSDIVLSDSRSISGRVVDHLGQPIVGARIRPSLVDVDDLGFEPPEYLSDADGNVVLKGIAMGDGGNYFLIEAETPFGPFLARLIWFPSKTRQTWETRRALGTLEVEGENFELKLPSPDPVKLEFVEKESGRPVNVLSASFWTLATRDETMQWRQKDLTKNGNAIEFGFLRPGLNFFKVKMDPDESLPDQLVVIKRVAGAERLESHRVEVAIGATIKGRVVEKGNLAPIADAAIAYIPRDPAALVRNGVVAPKFVRTNEDGIYEMVVPAADAKLRLAGECGPFCTPPVENGISSGGSLIDRSKIVKNFEMSFSPKPGQTVSLPAFELERSKVIRGRVIDQQGVAVPFAEFLVSRTSYQQDYSPKYGTTDEHGRFELGSVLTNALSDLPQFDSHRGIFFWDRDRTLVGNAKFSGLTEHDLEVVLKPANAILGRVVDGISSKPIAGAMITNSSSDLQIGAKTVSDGTFMLEFFSEQGGSFRVSSNGYRDARATVKFEPKEAIKEIDDIAIVAYNAYGTPERAPNLSDLPWDQALSVLEGYLQTELSRIPETQPDYDWNSSEPQFIFKTKVANELSGTVEKLLDEFDDPKDRVRLALLVFAQLNQDRASQKIPYTNTTKLLYSEVLLKNMDNPVVMESINKYDLQWSSPTHAEIALQNSQTDAAKIWAVRKLLGQPWVFQRGLSGASRQSDEQFELRLQSMKIAWQLGLNAYAEEPYSPMPPGFEIADSQRLGNIVRNQLKQVQKRISEQAQNVNRERAELVQEAINSLTQELP